MNRIAQQHFRRIVVGFDADGEPQVLIEAATVLARATSAKVVGVFVEDSGVMALAALPFVRVAQHPGSPAGELSTDRMRSAMARQAAACEAALSRTARLARFEWSFSRSQGSLREQITEQARNGDLIVVRADPYGNRTVLDALDMARDACSEAAGVVVIPTLARSVRGPVALVSAGDDTPLKAIHLAAAIAEDRGETLTIMLVAPDVGALAPLEPVLLDMNIDRRVVVRRVIGLDMRELARQVAEMGPSVLTVNLRGGLFEDDGIALALIEAAAAPVILLGGEHAE